MTYYFALCRDVSHVKAKHFTSTQLNSSSVLLYMIQDFEVSGPAECVVPLGERVSPGMLRYYMCCTAVQAVVEQQNSLAYCTTNSVIMR